MIKAFHKHPFSHPNSPSPLGFSLEAATYLVAAFAITGFGTYKASTATSYMEIIKWAQVASIVSQVGLIWLVAHLTRQKPVGLLVAVSVAYVVALIGHATSVSGLFFTYIKDIYLLPLSWGEGIIRPRIALNPWRASIDLSNLITVIWIPFAVWQQSRRGTRLHASCVGTLAFVVLAANLHDMYLVGPIYLAPYGLLLMLVVYRFCTPPARIASGTEPGDTGETIREMGAALRQYGFRHTRTRLFKLAQHPLLGVAMSMLLVTAAQMIGPDTLEQFVILLALVGMTQATIGTLYRVGSGKWLRRQAVLALTLLALSQTITILQGLETFSEYFYLGPQGLLHQRVHDWLWILGILMLLTAFYLAGMEAGDARKKLALEHRQLLAEVAERERAENDLRKSEKRFRTVIENCTDIISIIDARGNFMYVGSSVRQILGYDPDAIVGRHVFEFCHPDDAQPFEQTLEQLALKQHGSVQTTEVRIRHCDGSWRVMEGIGRNLLADPIVKGIVVNARDITERKLMAKRLEFVKSEEQQRIRYDLHDTVGQDLTGLLCLAGSLARRLRNGSDANAEQAEAIMEGIRHTISDVREAIHGISPVEADPRGLEVALGALVDKTRAQHGIDAQFECHAPVPISDYGAATQLFRIAQEAVTNVVKHAQAHQLVLSLTSDDKGVVLRITDDGVGTNGREKRTTGMGLQTMRSRAEAIGATLQVRGQDGGTGTRVECALSRDRYAKEIEENGPLNFQICG